MIEYPAKFLPCPVRDGYQYQLSHVNPITRTQMQNGRARQRRKFTSVPSIVELKWRLTDGEAQYFELWFSEILKDGAEWFNGPIRSPRSRAENVKMRFTGIYDGPILEGSWWIIRARMELYKRPLIDKDRLEFPEFIVYSDIIDMAINREWPRG